MKWKNELDVDDCDLFFSRGERLGSSYKELIVSYKTIYMNTYNVIVYDISGEGTTRTTIFRHEAF